MGKRDEGEAGCTVRGEEGREAQEEKIWKEEENIKGREDE